MIVATPSSGSMALSVISDMSNDDPHRTDASITPSSSCRQSRPGIAAWDSRIDASDSGQGALSRVTTSAMRATRPSPVTMTLPSKAGPASGAGIR